MREQGEQDDIEPIIFPSPRPDAIKSFKSPTYTLASNLIPGGVENSFQGVTQEDLNQLTSPEPKSELTVRMVRWPSSGLIMDPPTEQ